jgi:hypothetical protein
MKYHYINTAKIRLWASFADMALCAAQYVNMRAMVGAFKYAGHDDFAIFQDTAADRTDPGLVSVQAVDTALDMHEPVLAAVQGGENHGLYQFARQEFGGTDRAVPGIAGVGLLGVLVFPELFGVVPVRGDLAREGLAGRGLKDNIKEQGKAKPEEGYDGDDK